MCTLARGILMVANLIPEKPLNSHLIFFFVNFCSSLLQIQITDFQSIL